MAKLSLESVQDLVRRAGHEPLFNEYEGCKQKLKCKCKTHGIFYVKYVYIYNALKRNNGANGCKKCGLEKNRHNLDYAKECFINKNFKPLFTEYKEIREKLPYICNKHPELGIQQASLFKVINQYSPCPECSHENRLIYTEEQVIEMIISKGFIPRFEKFINTKQKFKLECPKHGIFYTNFNVIKNYNPCKKCADERLIKPEELRAHQDSRYYFEYLEWRKSVFARDNCQCKRCGSKDTIRAHHILNFKTHKELRTDINNGITFCEKCHKKFHGIYGNKVNNQNQIDEFIKKQN